MGFSNFSKLFSKVSYLLLILSILSTTGLASYLTEKNLYVTSQQTIPDVIEPGDQNIILLLDITHHGSRTYLNVSVDARFQDPFESIKNTYFLERMNPGDAYTTTFRFNVADADPGVYTIPIKISYIDSQTENKVTYNRYIYIQVSTLPKLEFYEIKTEDVMVGADFEVDFHINNIGSLSASEIYATIDTNSSAHITWLPDKKTIDLIAPGEGLIITFKGRTTDDTQSDSYHGTLTLEYSGKTLTNDFVLSIAGKPDLKLAGITTDEEPNPGKKISLSMQLENTGLGDAKSTKATINDPSIKGVLDSYIGTIQIDDTGTAIFDIILSEPGLNDIPIIIEYQDTKGNIYTAEVIFSLYNYPAPADTTAYIVAIVVAAVVLYFFYRKRQKHKMLKKVR